MGDNIIKIDYDNIDVEDIMRQIRENIKKRKYSSDELEKLSKELDTSFAEGDFDLTELGQNVALNNMRWSIQKAGQIKSNRRLIGPLIVLAKRVIRKFSYWYVQFLIDQQIEFNASVTRSINEIEKYIKNASSKKELISTVNTYKNRTERLEEDIEQLKEDIEKLENEKNELTKRVKSLEEKCLTYDKNSQRLEDVSKNVNKIIEINEIFSSKWDSIQNITQKQNSLEEEIKQLNNAVENKINENIRIEEVTAERLRRIEHYITYGEKDTFKAPDSVMKRSDSADMDYFLFEAKYRGSREEIKERQRVYLDYFMGRKNVLDIGCGRGEFIELLLENNVGALGIDLNLDNIHYCVDKGLPVKHAEAIEYLNSCEDFSIDGIFMAQVAEHLKPNALISLIRLARKKLQAGSSFIIETINPQSLIVFTESYFMDPTHIKMIHPLTIKFLFETEGFKNIEIKYLSPVSEDQKIPTLDCDAVNCKNLNSFNNGISRLNDLIYGCRDYAIVAKR